MSLQDGVFVDRDGRFGLIVERRQEGGADAWYARLADLSPADPVPPVKVDRAAEAAADVERIGLLVRMEAEPEV